MANIFEGLAHCFGYKKLTEKVIIRSCFLRVVMGNRTTNGKLALSFPKHGNSTVYKIYMSFVLLDSVFWIGSKRFTTSIRVCFTARVNEATGVRVYNSHLWTVFQQLAVVVQRPRVRLYG